MTVSNLWWEWLRNWATLLGVAIVEPFLPWIQAIGNFDDICSGLSCECILLLSIGGGMRNGKYFLEGVNMTESQIIIPETIIKTEVDEVKHRRNTVFNSQTGIVRQMRIEDGDEREMMGLSWKNSTKYDFASRDFKRTSLVGPTVRQERKYTYQGNNTHVANQLPTSPRANNSQNLPAEQRELLQDFHGSTTNNLYNIFV